MRPQQLIVWKLIESVVAKVNTAVIAELTAYDEFIQKVNFQAGTITEINNTLDLMARQSDKQYQRYPLFGLLFSFNEDKGREIGMDGVEDLTIIIARRANRDDKVPARYDNNFIPVLYPVYLEFLNQLWLDPRFSTNQPQLIPHVKTDFPYYWDPDNDKKDPLSDTVDAIQIKIKLKILLKNC